MNELKASEPIVEINQALNGMEGPALVALSHLMIDTRIEIMQELTKKRSKVPIILEELRDFSEEYIDTKYNKPTTALNIIDEKSAQNKEESVRKHESVPWDFFQTIKSEEISELLSDLQLIKSLI